MSEFVDWIAFYKLEQQDIEEARRRAQDKAAADKLLREMSGQRF